MAFKMTPGIKGNPSMNRIKNLGACGGPGQPPCEPRFQKEVEEKRMQAVDRSSSARGKSIKAKIKQSPIKDAPVKPVKLQINLPKGYEFASKKEESMFYDMFEESLRNGKYKTQEELDMAIMQRLKGGGPVKPGELKINLPKGYEFKDGVAERMFYEKFEEALRRGKFETQAQLDMAIMEQLKGTIDGPKDPEGPIVRPPGKLDPKEPIKGGGEFEASPIKSVIKK